MQIAYINPLRSEWTALTERNDDPAVDAAVSAIIDEVRLYDAALREMALNSDRCNVGAALKLPEAGGRRRMRVRGQGGTGTCEGKTYRNSMRPRCLRRSMSRRPRSEIPAQRPVATDRVGLYISREAPLFSTVLALRGTSGKDCGCREVILCTPQSGDRPIAPKSSMRLRFAALDRFIAPRSAGYRRNGSNRDHRPCRQDFRAGKPLHAQRLTNI